MIKSSAALFGPLVAALLLAGAIGRAGEVDIDIDTPVATIATLQRGLIALSQQRPDATLEERYAALEPLIKATHDLPYIAEFALRRQWAGLNDADRERFVAAFERLSVMTYAARFGRVGPDTFRPITAGEVTANGRAQVSTAVARASSADVSLEYLLQQGPSGWRIINIVADGVSDLALKRAEYQRVLASGPIDTLIAELDSQAERLRQR
jgi:phospholipid transport system substrate-binding protein